MKITTVTLNPAIDQTVRVDGFRPGTVNRGQSMQWDAGGKGVNVAAFLADYGHQVVVTGFLGQENPELFEQLFARKRIADRFVRIPGRTRTGIKIVDEAARQTTDINLPGQAPTPEAIAALLVTVVQLADECDWFALSGNLPPGVPEPLYAEIITRLKAYGRSVVLDTSRDALRLGIQAGPTVVKPNVDELSELCGETLSDEVAIERAACRLLANDIELVVVSMGERGALFVDTARALVAVPPAVAVKSSVGAGDALVAGLIAGRARGMDLADCARLATAFAAGAITRLGAHLPPRPELDPLFGQVAVRRLRDTA
ncbi:MAG: 1-phosphofructokinase [Chloroflexi bacterium HGW-Chloroflexi-1]|nr:MAG: 1-phosphofructokinase [Chloroflexi bacterium HGW-Chloroflexi-1]